MTVSLLKARCLSALLLPVLAWAIIIVVAPVVLAQEKAPPAIVLALPSESSPAGGFHLKALPAEPAVDHQFNSRLNMGPFHLSSLIQVPYLKPVKMDASYNQPISLKEALNYALENNLPIKISRESFNYQRFQLYGSIATALPIPNFSSSYSLLRTHISEGDVSSNSILWQTVVRYPVFQGGSAVYGALAQYYRTQGWKQAYYQSINDALLTVYQNYQNLVQQNALLEIQAKSLELAETQLRLNNSLYQSGSGTQFAIMQSRTQLASARQSMLSQQAAVRQAALSLAFSLNLPMTINLVPEETAVGESPIIDPHLPINELLNLAINYRPELRQYEMFRLAAARNVQIAAAPLYPTVSFFTSYTYSNVTVSPAGGNLGGAAVAQITAATSGLGTASANALGQTASFSPTGSTTANSGVNNTVNTPIVASSGGQPLNVVQSGGIVTSGAAAPSFNNGSGSFSSSANINGSNTASAGVFPGLFNTWQAGFSLNWSLSNMGLNSAANILAAKALSRQALLQCNQELLLVSQQVRSDYLTALTDREQIDKAAYGVASSLDELRQANLRLLNGLGTNLELIQAQRDYISALTAQVQAIVASNLAQAQILHDTGVISVETLTAGYKPGSFPARRT